MQAATTQPKHVATMEASSEPAAAAPLPLPFEGHRRRLPPADKLFADGDYEREAQATQHWEVRFSSRPPAAGCWRERSMVCLQIGVSYEAPSTTLRGHAPWSGRAADVFMFPWPGLASRPEPIVPAAGGAAEAALGRQLRVPPVLRVRRAAADRAPAGHPPVRDARLLLRRAGGAQAQGAPGIQAHFVVNLQGILRLHGC